MSTQSANISGKSLSYQYDWFQRTFPSVMQQVFDDFFAEDFTFTLLGVCRNVNSLVDKDAYFVTKIKIDQQHDMFFRLSETAIRMVLDKSLGRANGAFDLAKLTELETKIVTVFNDTLYRAVLKHIQPPPPTITRTNFDVVFMTFALTDRESGKAGRFVVALPDVLVAPEEIQETFDYPIEHFERSVVSVRLDVGRTIFKLHEVKNLEVDDMVIFEDSNVEKMRLFFRDYETDVLLKPRMELMVHVDDDGGLEMPNENINIWDSIEVEMVAHFDSVDVTLGELKKIQAGMVVDLVSIYNNRVTLTVEDKPIASGELVIVNDKYGVKITEVHAPKAVSETYVAPVGGADVQAGADYDGSQGVNESVSAGIPGNDEEEEFDYSDFDLEEDI